MRAALFVLCLCIASVQADVIELARSSKFDSVNAFVTAAGAFQPAKSKSDLAEMFTVRELGQPEDPKTGTPVAATSILSAADLWSDSSHAFVFVSASPPTEATRSAVGVLFLLTRKERSWSISDVLRFTPTGKEAEVTAELTAYAGSGYHLGREGMMPVITIKSCHGGRGYAYQLSASYVMRNDRIERIEPK